MSQKFPAAPADVRVGIVNPIFSSVCRSHDIVACEPHGDWVPSACPQVQRVVRDVVEEGSRGFRKIPRRLFSFLKDSEWGTNGFAGQRRGPKGSDRLPKGFAGHRRSEGQWNRIAAKGGEGRRWGSGREEAPKGAEARTGIARHRRAPKSTEGLQRTPECFESPEKKLLHIPADIVRNLFGLMGFLRSLFRTLRSPCLRILKMSMLAHSHSQSLINDRRKPFRPSFFCCQGKLRCRLDTSRAASDGWPWQ